MDSRLPCFCSCLSIPRSGETTFSQSVVRRNRPAKLGPGAAGPVRGCSLGLAGMPNDRSFSVPTKVCGEGFRLSDGPRDLSLFSCVGLKSAFLTRSWRSWFARRRIQGANEVRNRALRGEPQRRVARPDAPGPSVLTTMRSCQLRTRWVGPVMPDASRGSRARGPSTRGSRNVREDA